VMVSAAGCSAELLLSVSPDHWPEVSDTAKQLGLENVLAIMQVLDQTLSRLRYSTQARILAELALVRIATLGDVAELSELVAELKAGATLAGGAGQGVPSTAMPTESGEFKKKGGDSPSPLTGSSSLARGNASVPPVAAFVALSPENATEIWSQAAARLPGLVGEHSRHFSRVATPAPNRLVVGFRQEYTFSKSICEEPANRAKFERALAEVTGQRVQLEFEVIDGGESKGAIAPPVRSKTVLQRRAEVAQNPMVRRAAELFGAFPERIDEPGANG